MLDCLGLSIPNVCSLIYRPLSAKLHSRPLAILSCVQYCKQDKLGRSFEKESTTPVCMALHHRPNRFCDNHHSVDSHVIFYDPGILPGTHLGIVLGSNPKGNLAGHLKESTCNSRKLVSHQPFQLQATAGPPYHWDKTSCKACVADAGRSAHSWDNHFTMKLTAVSILKWNGEKDAFLLGIAADLSSFGYFQRSTVKEMLTFLSRTVAKRTQPGQRQSVQQEEYYAHIYNRDGLVGIAIVDKDYPARAAFGVVNKVLDDFSENSQQRWRSIQADSTDAQSVLDSAVIKFQVCSDRTTPNGEEFVSKYCNLTQMLHNVYHASRFFW